jgi:predicted secreted Zn-dependent protease
MIQRFLLSSLLLLSATASASAVDLVKTYRYFTIGGTTLEEIQKELATRGPHVGRSGSRHPGATRMAFTTHIGYARGPGFCRISSARVTLKVDITLPRWNRRSRSEQDVRLFWDTLSADIRRHEGQHVDIATEYARKLESALAASGRQKDCDAAAAKAKAITAKILAEHDNAQIRFDRVELVNFESRILRLLKYRAERIQSGRLPMP